MILVRTSFMQTAKWKLEIVQNFPNQQRQKIFPSEQNRLKIPLIFLAETVLIHTCIRSNCLYLLTTYIKHSVDFVAEIDLVKVNLVDLLTTLRSATTCMRTDRRRFEFETLYLLPWDPSIASIEVMVLYERFQVVVTDLVIPSCKFQFRLTKGLGQQYCSV